MAASKIIGGTTKPSMMVLSNGTLIVLPILKSDSTRPMAIMIVGYDALSLALRIAPRKDRKITSDTTATGDQAIGAVTHFTSTRSRMRV